MSKGRTFGPMFLAIPVALWSQGMHLPSSGVAEGDLAAGKADEFLVEVRTGDVLDAVLNGYGALFSLEILDPDDKSLTKQQRAGGNRDPIVWAAIIDHAGSFKLKIVSGEVAESLHYRLTVLQRPAEDRDRIRVSAQSALVLGEQSGQGKEAIVLLDRSEQLAAQAGDLPLEAEALLHLAQAEFSEGRAAQAESVFGRAIEKWRGAGDKAGEARALRGLGKLYGDTQQSAKAVSTLEQALELSHKLGDPSGEAEALRELGSVAGARSEYAKAEDLFNRGLSLARQASDRHTEADILNMLGVLDQYTGKETEALTNYEQALAIRRSISDRAGVAQSTTNLGVFHRNLGENRAAIGYFEEALAMRRKLNVAQGTAATLANLGVAQADLGNFEESLALSREAADLFHSSQGRRGETFALINLGDDYIRLGDAQKALDYYSRSLALAKTSGDRRAQAIVLLSTGAIHASLGKFDLAFETYSEALKISRDAGDKREEARALMALAEMDWSRGDRTEASTKGREALAAIRLLDDRREEAHALSFLGSTLIDSDRKHGVEMLERALEIQKEIIDPDQEAVTRSRLARAAVQAGNLSGAREQALAALNLIESVRRNAPPAGPRVSFQASKQPIYQQTVDILLGLNHLDPPHGYGAEALQVVERSRARALLDQLAQGKISYDSKTDPTLSREAARTLELLDAKAARLTEVLSGRHTPSQAERARREVDDLEAHYDETLARVRSHCPVCLDLIDPRPLSLAGIQREILDSGTVLLEYSVEPARSHLWAISKTSFRTYDLPGSGEIEKLVQEMRAALAEPGRPVDNETEEMRQRRFARSQAEVERIAGVLAHAIVPCVKELYGKKVLIAADGAIHYVPFTTLLARGTETVEIPSASSLSLLRRNYGNRLPGSDSIEVFADPAYPAGSSEFPRLRLSREEGLRIASLAPGKKKILLGADVTRARIEDPTLSQYSILHFAAHAWMDAERPELSGIALSDGVVRLNDIYHLDLNARLVVLSACRTALGKPADGEGPISLARAFLYAGASSVVASLWDVDDRATEVFMTRFYDGLFRRNLSPAAALEFARDSMRATAAWRHPYYWAGFVLIGDSTRHG